MAIEDDILFFEQAPMLRLLGRTALRILALGVRSHDVSSSSNATISGLISSIWYSTKRRRSQR